MTQPPVQPGFDADAAINECLDLEASGRPDELRDLLARARAEDPSFDAKLLQTRAVIGQLRRSPLAPDVSREILTEVDYLRPFLSPRRRRQVSATRVAVAAAAVITLSFMGIMQRMYPHNPPPAPVDSAVMASGADTGETVHSIASAVNDLRTPASKPAAVGKPHRWEGPLWSGPAPTALSMGDTSRYEAGSNWSLSLTLTPAGAGPLLDYHASEERLKLAQTGWPEAPEAQPITLTLSGGLIELARTSSVVSRFQQERATLDLHADAPMSPPWSGRTELERLLGPGDAAKVIRK
jgi:hypothetical protein